LEKLNPDVLFSLLERQKGWIDGVVFTGGEPTLQPGLADLIRRARDHGAAVKLHTNGCRPGVVAALLDEGLVDCLALDYKAPLDGRFFDAAGVAPDRAMLEAVRETFRLASGSNADCEYHTTLAPRFIDADSLSVMAERLEPGGLWILQQFENNDCLDQRLAGDKRYGDEELDALEAVAKSRHSRVLMKRGRSA
jgi:pyruvate formate lyase activating enzyme